MARRLTRRGLHRVIVHVADAATAARFEFLKDTKESARRLAEGLATSGFWIPRPRLATFVPPSRIELVEVRPITTKTDR